MNKKGLVLAVEKVLGSRRDAQRAVNAFIAAMKNTLGKGDRVVISCFGSFQPFTARSKKVRNPRTGETLYISPRKKIRFRQSKSF